MIESLSEPKEVLATYVSMGAEKLRRENAATGLAGTGSWHTVFEKRSPFYTTDWNQIPEVL